jgi:predicted PurR-regulated permease PerM
MVLGLIGYGTVGLIAAPVLLVLFIRYYWKYFKKKNAAK